MAIYKKLEFSKFSLCRKIIVLFLLIMLVLGFIFSVNAWRLGAGLSVWTFFSAIYFFALFLVTYNLHNLKKILKKTYKPLTVIFYSGMILFFVVFTVFCFLILGYTSGNIPDNPDLVIVLGCQVYGYNPSTELKSRLNKSIGILNKYPDLICIVSGGQGYDETVAEAAVMKKYLVDNNISENRIYEEDESSNTLENLLLSKKLIEDNNLKHGNIIIVTSEYHIPRATLIAKRIYPADAQFYAVKAKSPFPMIFPLFNAGIVREFFAFVKSFIFDRG